MPVHAFVFPGQGSQSVGMGRDLAAAFAAAREVFEEAGVHVADVTYHSSQPWPFPASLMLGFHARATTTDIHIDPDEIEAANWFSRDFLKQNIRGGKDFFVPPGIAVARRLIDDWVVGNA